MEILNTIWTALTTENEMLTNILFMPFMFIEMLITMLLFLTILKIVSTKKQKISYVFILSLIGLIAVIIRRVLYPGSSIFGWASMVCIILLLGGLQLLCIGILGKYIGRVYIQVKNRPIYIIKEKK